MTIQEYVDQLNLRYKSGISREHSYRGDLQTLLSNLLPDLLITNEPSRTDVGAPDYILTKGKIPVGYIEAKDIGDPDLEGKKRNKEQFERYKTGLPNLIFTDYLDFRVYRDGEFLTSVAIAEIKDGSIVGLTKNYNEFENIIKDFGTHVGQTIRSANKLSKMMGSMQMDGNMNMMEMHQKMMDNPEMKQRMQAHMKMMQSMMDGDMDHSNMKNMMEDSSMMKMHMMCMQMMQGDMMMNGEGMMDKKDGMNGSNHQQHHN